MRTATATLLCLSCCHLTPHLSNLLGQVLNGLQAVQLGPNSPASRSGRKEQSPREAVLHVSARQSSHHITTAVHAQIHCCSDHDRVLCPVTTHECQMQGSTYISSQEDYTGLFKNYGIVGVSKNLVDYQKVCGSSVALQTCIWVCTSSCFLVACSGVMLLASAGAAKAGCPPVCRWPSSARPTSFATGLPIITSLCHMCASCRATCDAGVPTICCLVVHIQMLISSLHLL